VLADVADVHPSAPHNVANALAAAALARSLHHAGVLTVRPRRCAPASRRRPGRAPIAHVVTVDDVAYVDDSKATNAHGGRVAAGVPARRLGGRRAGQGGRFDELVAGAADRLRAPS
jgi:UDP-N-acetylmuramoylalanine--D-glutamate ligase